MHEVATLLYTPNSADQSTGNTATFGATINIINGGIECGKGYETAAASDRIKYYQQYLSFFGISDGYGGFSCANMHGFSSDGWGAQETAL